MLARTKAGSLRRATMPGSLRWATLLRSVALSRATPTEEVVISAAAAAAAAVAAEGMCTTDLQGT